MADKTTRDKVRQAYADVAVKRGSCCKSSCCGDNDAGPVPEADLGLSCGNPLAFGRLRPGMTVVDLGSGAGKDVFGAAKIVGPTGKSIGVDMTDEMLALARKHAVKFALDSGLTNVEFRKGYIEDLPLEDASADVVISNCVINLSPDKPKVFREVYRVLKPGGAMIVSDIVLRRALPKEVRENDDLYSACIAGAMMRDDYLAAIKAGGFASMEMLAEHGYQSSGLNGDPLTSSVSQLLAQAAVSITVLASK